MATTKILPVRKRLKDCLDYAANPKKTEIFRGDALDRLMHYTQNEDKTEHQLYVTGFNCDPQNACLIMEATKRRWHKDIGHGNVGYHIIQSFKPGEASPDQVHQIGCELARRCLADRFECTVSTHLDKGHLHNHIVVNSVSFMDGKMFRNDFKTYYGTNLGAGSARVPLVFRSWCGPAAILRWARCMTVPRPTATSPARR